MANYLPVMLSDPVLTWLISLPADSIDSWDDLKKAFVENYRSTYKSPSSKFDLARMYQKSGETLRSFIRRFSEKRNSIPNIAEVEVINAFINGIHNADLRNKLNRKPPTRIGDMLNTAE